MRRATVYFWLLQILITATIAQDAGPTLPQCALVCSASTPGGTDQQRICTDPALRMELAACTGKTCTIKEILTTTNITATMCDWPHRDASSLIKTVIIPFLFLTTVAVTTRLTARLPHYSGFFGNDDYVIFVVWVLAVVFTVLIWHISSTGLGKDIWTVSFDDITLTLQYYVILTDFYISLTWLTKISILLLYLRIFPDHQFRGTVKIILILFCMAGFSFLLGTILRCLPVDHAWNIWDGEHKGKCTPILTSAVGWPHLCINIAADLLVLCMPLPTLWKLNLPLEKKLSVMAMFSVGLFVTIVSIFRATTFPRLITSTNFTWEWNQPGLWSAIEVYVGIICACMPGMRAFYTQVFPGKRWRERRSQRNKNSLGGTTLASDPLSSSGTTKSGSRGAGGERASMLSQLRRDNNEFELLEDVDLDERSNETRV